MTSDQTTRLPPCSKCKGTQALDQDQYGAYLKCLNCGKQTQPGTQPDSDSAAGIRDGPSIHLIPDNGCNLAPSCLRCPFPECKHDRISVSRSTAAKIRDKEMVHAIQEGLLTNKEAAEKYGLTPKTVSRIFLRATLP